MSTADKPPAWSIDHSAYPVSGPVSAQLEFLVRYAVLAPSTHNSQPWLFRVRGDSLELFADRSRALPVSDPHDRELTISCGAALAHAVLAARNFGHEAETELLPGGHPDLLARLRLAGRRAPTHAEDRRFRAMPERRTTRTAFTQEPVSSEILGTLGQLASAQRAMLATLVDTADRESIAGLVMEADHVQMANPAFREELAKWVHPLASRTGDGMSIASFGQSDRLSAAVAGVIRLFDVGAGVAARDRQIASGSPVLAVLSTGADTPLDWLHCGMALANILLEATASGLRTAFLNQPVEVPELREKLRHAARAEGMPQLLMRLGHGPRIPPAPRREARLVIGS